ncbi:MAG: SDR family oxidoreductase [Nannocystaceae bacterium]|nr:SDR family oxidoreductase [Nannocystaceae bacterium]
MSDAGTAGRAGGWSIRETLAGKRVLLTGASGFVGKVWLAMMLDRLPQIGRIYVLLRGKGRGARERFEKIVNESPVFKPLHEAQEGRMSEFVSQRVEVVAGDVSAPKLGMDDATYERLVADVDVVLNFAGLVDFNPDVRDALASNVDGAMHVADFCERSGRAVLLHVSTCYVAGHRDGRVPEAPVGDRSPGGKPLQAQAEYAALQQLIADVHAENDDPATEASLRDDVLRRLAERGHEGDYKRVTDMVGRLKRKRLRENMAKAGTDRAKSLGWPNTYTYTKALAEALLQQRADRVRVSVLRPAIVESATEFPFAGWNEGFNTSGPLVYLAGTWFRHVPAAAGNPLDVIPVDFVCKAITIVACALLRDEASPVYQCGSSDRNFLAIDRLTELSALGHRKHLREHGANALEKLVLSRWDAKAADPEHVLNVTNIRKLMAQVTRYLKHGRPEKIPSEVREWADDMSKTTDNGVRKLRQIEDVLELFMPFTYEHYCVFVCRAIDRHVIIEPEFRFAPETIEWRSYWLDVHMPGLRRWCFPEYEDKPKEIYTPKTPFRLLDPPAAASPSVTSTSVGEVGS